MREMSISENYEGEITPIRSNISRFSRGTDGTAFRALTLRDRLLHISLNRSSGPEEPLSDRTIDEALDDIGPSA